MVNSETGVLQYTQDALNQTREFKIILYHAFLTHPTMVRSFFLLFTLVLNDGFFFSMDWLRLCWCGLLLVSDGLCLFRWSLEVLNYQCPTLGLCQSLEGWDVCLDNIVDCMVLYSCAKWRFFFLMDWLRLCWCGLLLVSDGLCLYFFDGH